MSEDGAFSRGIATEDQKTGAFAWLEKGLRLPLQVGINRLVEIAFPSACLACGVICETQPGLCVNCWQQVRFVSDPVCPVLGAPFEFDRGEGVLSAAAIAQRPDFDRARAAVIYGPVTKKLVTKLKFGSRTEIAKLLARMMERVAEELIEDDTHIVPVPLHRRRQWSRRFNQSGLIAHHLSRHFKAPLAQDILFRNRATRQQVGLTGRQRRANVSGAFKVDRERLNAKGVQKVVLVDDVYTTGSTVNAAARVLRRAGVQEIGVLTFARVGGLELTPDDLRFEQDL